MAEKLAINGGGKAVTMKYPLWPQIEQEDIDAVVTALNKVKEDTRYLTAAGGGGPLKDFEEDFGELLGVEHVMSTNSGTAALHIGVMAAGVQAGDEVIVSPYTWGQTVGPILHQNGIPVFADIDPETYNLDPESVEGKITPSTKAIMVVHLYGQPADMDAIMAVANRHGIKVIEDCAQANGAIYKGKRVGSLGHVGCFSVGDGKNIVGGEGGALVTSDRDIFERAVLMGLHPLVQEPTLTDPDLRKYIDSIGYSYRIHPLAAVLVRNQLKHLDEWNDVRRENAQYLSNGLEKIPGVMPPHVSPDVEHVFNQYSPSYFEAELSGLPKGKFIEAVAAEGVELFAYVKVPIYLRPRHQDHHFFYGKGCPWSCGHAAREVVYNKGDCPVAEERCEKRELNMRIPMLPSKELFDQVLDAFRKVAENVDQIELD